MYNNCYECLYANEYNSNHKTKNISINIHPNGNKRAQMVKNRRRLNRTGIRQKEMKVNTIYNESCLSTLARMDSDTVDLIVTSPPYNKGYWSSNRNLNNGFGTKSRRIEYNGFDDNLKPVDYNKFHTKVIKECLRVLKPSGSMFYNHQPIQKMHQEINPSFVYEFPVKQTIIWDRSSTPKLDKSYFLPVIEYIFWIQKTPQARVKFDRKKALYLTSVWKISPDKKNKFPAPFPENLVKNCILSCTDKGDLIYDPFMGSGTTAVVAKKLNRLFIGSEIGSTELANQRILEV